MISRGYFVIADITGYTEFLTQSGLEEAQSILDHLFEGLLGAIKAPLTISNFQGDAILAFAPSGSFTYGQTLLEILENIYNAFVSLVELMEHNVGCGCNACTNLPKLDLKIFVHYGDYILQNLRGRQEISGPDVILVHRIMKNRVREETGLRSYGLFTEAAINELDIPEIRAGMREVSEYYEHLGEVKLFVYDIRAKYEQRRELRRIFVRPDQAIIFNESDLPAPPPLIWEYLTQPVFVKEWMTFDAVHSAVTGKGKVARGSTFRCIRSAEHLDYTIVDMRPFDYLTIEATGPHNVQFHVSYCLFPGNGVTVFKLYWKPISNAPLPDVINRYREFYKTCTEKLTAMISMNLESGKVRASEPGMDYVLE